MLVFAVFDVPLSTSGLGVDPTPFLSVIKSTQDGSGMLSKIPTSPPAFFAFFVLYLSPQLQVPRCHRSHPAFSRGRRCRRGRLSYRRGSSRGARDMTGLRCRQAGRKHVMVESWCDGQFRRLRLGGSLLTIAWGGLMACKLHGLPLTLTEP